MMPKKASWWPEEQIYIGLIDRLAANLRGYVRLQSGRVSRGRQTMMDSSDERKTNAWIAAVWKESDGAREWPRALRPQRPERMEMRTRVSMKGVEANRRRNKNLQVLETPPVFLQIKDVKKSSVQSDMTTDMQLLGLQLERELRLDQQELSLKRILLEETRKELQTVTAELRDARKDLNKERTESQELKAQLAVRVQAIEKLEEENSKLRDMMTRIKVQVDAYMVERQPLLDRCHNAEVEALQLKNQLGQLQNELESCATFKESYLYLQTQTRSMIDAILSKQEQLNKEQARLDRCCQEGLSFAKKVSQRAELEAEYVKKANVCRRQLEDKIIQLMAALEEKQKISEPNSSNERKEDYLEEWAAYQQEMNLRAKAFIEENQRLSEEINLLRLQKENCSRCRFDKIKPETLGHPPE